MPVVLLCILALNLSDALMTIHAVQSGFGVELNPMMDELLKIGPTTFTFFKMLIAASICAILFLRRAHAVSRSVAFFVLGFYCSVVLSNALLLIRFYHE